MTMDVRFVVSMVIVAMFALAAGWLLIDSDALRDESSASPKPYSLARVQLWWWTVLILGSWILVYGITKDLWPFDPMCLALMGISGATTAAGRIIDGRDAQPDDGATARHQDEASKGFFTDILSDAHGISIHRFQAIAFNVMYGAAFLLEVFTHLKAKGFPENVFDGNTLALLGLSSGAYVAMKALENKAAPAEKKQSQTAHEAARAADQGAAPPAAG